MAATFSLSPHSLLSHATPSAPVTDAGADGHVKRQTSTQEIPGLQPARRLMIVIVVGILCLAAGNRLLLLTLGSVSFHSDEAVVGLMARHINVTGQVPPFFYGQAYMGSLDPWLVALAFRIVGESASAIRLVQSILYLIVTGLIMVLAWRVAPVTERAAAVLISGLLFALPTPLVATYTTISLGGYGEMLICGLLLFVVLPPKSPPRKPVDLVWRAALSGLLAGVGWWTNGLIVMFMVPVLLAWLIILWRDLRSADRLAREARPVFLSAVPVAVIAFLIGAAPWIIENLHTAWASVRFLGGGFGSPPFIDKVVGLIALGLPAVIGARYPWASDWFGGVFLLILLYAVICWIYIYAMTQLQRRKFSNPVEIALCAMPPIFCGIFLASGFGIDSTGRYLLPLSPILAVLIGVGFARRRWGVIVACFLALLFTVSTLSAAITRPTGLTPQFDPATDLSNQADQALLDFLERQQITRGYSTYWISYRMVFLSGERVQFSPALPYKADLTSPGPDRYALYTRHVLDATTRDEPIAYIAVYDTALEQALSAAFQSQNIAYQRQVITIPGTTTGVFTVYYALSPNVMPDMLSLRMPLRK